MLLINIFKACDMAQRNNYDFQIEIDIILLLFLRPDLELFNTFQDTTPHQNHSSIA